MSSGQKYDTGGGPSDGPVIADGHFWVFGYGSLMWNPGFDHVERVPARMGGVHRAPCIYSWVHRGTQQNPGIVLGLDEGGSCSGMAFRVEAKNSDKVVGYLRDRELVTNVYLETVRPAQLLSAGASRTVPCLTYVVDRYHEQYAGKLPVEDMIKIISRSRGKSGPNDAYFLDTHRQLDEMGIHDPLMSEIAEGLKFSQSRPVTSAS